MILLCEFQSGSSTLDFNRNKAREVLHEFKLFELQEFTAQLRVLLL